MSDSIKGFLFTETTLTLFIPYKISSILISLDNQTVSVTSDTGEANWLAY